LTNTTATFKHNETVVSKTSPDGKTTIQKVDPYYGDLDLPSWVSNKKYRKLVEKDEEEGGDPTIPFTTLVYSSLHSWKGVENTNYEGDDPEFENSDAGRAGEWPTVWSPIFLVTFCIQEGFSAELISKYFKPIWDLNPDEKMKVEIDTSGFDKFVYVSFYAEQPNKTDYGNSVQVCFYPENILDRKDSFIFDDIALFTNAEHLFDNIVERAERRASSGVKASEGFSEQDVYFPTTNSKGEPYFVWVRVTEEEVYAL
jgi:hypothetical protein